MIKNTICGLFLFIVFLFIPTFTIKAEDSKPLITRGLQCMVTIAQNTDFRVPVDYSKTYISTEYEDYHPGIDFASNSVEDHPAIYAIEKGIVVYEGNSAYDYSENGVWYAGYGNVVVIDHLNGLYSLYGHLNEINVKKGQLLEKGKIIGRMGATGYATGTHLHFEICTTACKTSLTFKHNPHTFMDISKVLVRLE